MAPLTSYFKHAVKHHENYLKFYQQVSHQTTLKVSLQLRRQISLNEINQVGLNGEVVHSKENAQLEI